VAAQLGADAEDLLDKRLLLVPALLQELQAVLLGLGHQLVVGFGLARRRLDADRLLAADDPELGVERLDAPPAVVHLGRHGVLADRDAGARRV
jgi:hypothetical protein